MKISQSLMLASALMLMLPVSLPAAWADDGGRGHDGGMYAQGHDRGDHRDRGFDRGDRGGGDRGFDRGDRGGGDRGFDRGDRGGGDRGFRRDDDRGRRPGYIFDNRYHHDRYYPPRGYAVRELPRGYMAFHYHGDRYFYWGGIWYVGSGLSFVVVAPPFGVVVPVLPPYYTTVWVGGVPYYYANGVYYVWQPVQQGYVVTQPPAASSDVVPQSQQGPDQFYVYPKKGQSADQQAKDRYECHHWAVDQTGFDPSQPATNLSDAQLSAKRAGYRRAIEACLDARGYSVK
jgi:Family of unknown function (DUF6515)